MNNSQYLKLSLRQVHSFRSAVWRRRHATPASRDAGTSQRTTLQLNQVFLTNDKNNTAGATRRRCQMTQDSNTAGATRRRRRVTPAHHKEQHCN